MGDRHTILLVDDDELLLKSMERWLRHESRRVLIATNPRNAIDWLSRESIDVVISDERMPEMSGRKLLTLVKEKQPEAVRILMTGHASLESALEVINRDEAHRYLVKPIEMNVLLAELDAAVQKVNEQRKKAQVAKQIDRRQRIVDELEAEYPGLTAVTPGLHTPTRDAFGDKLLATASVAMARVPQELTHLAELGSYDVRKLADQLLLVPMKYPRASLILDPRPAEVRVVLDSGSANHVLGATTNSRGDALAARLALLADLDLSAIGQQLGKVEIHTSEGSGEVLIALRTSAIGLSIEMRRLLQMQDIDVQTQDSSTLGQYQLLDTLGEGAGGVVYRALHTELQRHVAIKVMKTSAAQDPLAAARLLREARAASRSRSSGIVDVLDYGRLSDGKPFIVMELIESQTLEKRLEEGALPIEMAITIARNLAVAIGAAHDAGVIHRDLKPSNVFVDDDLNVKVSDFGAAKLVNDAGPALTQEGMTIGTPHYMSPEQARGETVDRRSDIYALGCVLFEMLAGHPPYEGETSIAVLTAHVVSAVPTPTSPFGPLPLALSRTVTRAMAKTRAARHQHSGELTADLDQAMSSIRRGGWRKWLP